MCFLDITTCVVTAKVTENESTLTTSMDFLLRITVLMCLTVSELRFVKYEDKSVLFTFTAYPHFRIA